MCKLQHQTEVYAGWCSCRLLRFWSAACLAFFLLALLPCGGHLAIAATSKTCADGPAARAFPLGLGGFLVVLVLSWLSGTNLFSLLGTRITVPDGRHLRARFRARRAEERMVDIVGAVTKDSAGHVGREAGPRYQRHRRSRCSAMRWTPAAGSRNRRPGRSIARRIARSISISASSTSCRGGSARRRLRAGLRDRPRVRPPRAEPLGAERACALPIGGRAPTARRSRSNCRPTASPASGAITRRSPARRSGQVKLDPGDVEEGAARGGGDRRRSAAEDEHRPGDARSLYARIVGAASRVVQAGDGNRRSALVQRVDRDELSARTARAGFWVLGSGFMLVQVRRTGTLNPNQPRTQQPEP